VRVASIILAALLDGASRLFRRIATGIGESRTSIVAFSSASLKPMIRLLTAEKIVRSAVDEEWIGTAIERRGEAADREQRGCGPHLMQRRTNRGNLFAFCAVQKGGSSS
jgi:hypothetical protein